MTSVTLDTIILGSADPDRLRRWYVVVLDARPDVDGFFSLGGTDLLVEGRDGLSSRATDAGRILLTYHVRDIRVVADRLRSLAAPWVAEVEYRADAGAWFGTVEDPDGNLVQFIQLTPQYWVNKRQRAGAAPTGSGAPGPLERAAVAVRLPAADLGRARAFYRDRLGLEPVESRPGGLRYECGGTSFVLFESGGSPSGEHTQMAISVTDLDTVVSELRARGLEFDEPDGAFGEADPNGVVRVEGNYPSTGASGERAIWFHDSEGNLIGLGEPVG
ncbi:VOC family protein [Plantactinospora sp. GCM10030261]|uniref:VOC family protein n=1 Tax=Plantactinospora sp. GCM10030261 TaxID=3273420 RepID=UPI00360D57A2